MSNHLGNPYRGPCGGWPAQLVPFLGPRDQHCNDADKHKPVYDNVTRMRNPACDFSNPLSPVCPGYMGTPPADVVCVPVSPLPGRDQCEEDPPAVQIPYCDAFLASSPPCGSGPNVAQVYDNCYLLRTPPLFYDFSKCRKIGFKNLIAAKYWQGIYGWDYSDGCGTPAVYGASPPTTKYLTCHILANATKNVDGVTAATVERQYTVGRFTGETTRDVCNDSSTNPESPFFPREILLEWIGIRYHCGIWDSGLPVDLNGGATSNYDGTNAPIWDLNTVDTPTATTLHFKFTQYIDNSGQFESYEYTITLSNPYTAADVNADCDAALNAWRGYFEDDAVYPWRTDTLCILAPLVSYDEATSNSPDSYNECDAPATGGSSTGQILGLPAPAGYGKFFDFRARVYTFRTCAECDSPPEDGCNFSELHRGSPCCFLDLSGIGDFAPDWCPHATQWLDLNHAQASFSGAWQQHQNRISTLDPFVILGGKLAKCIWAETIMFTKPSHNYARPCGPADAAAQDQVLVADGGSGVCQEDGTYTAALRFPGVPNVCPDPPAANGQWNDTGAKGDFLCKEWQHDFRDYAIDQTSLTPSLRLITQDFKNFIATQACIAHTPCCPNVAYIAPAGVSFGFSNSVKYLMPAAGLDDTFGTLWQGRVEQWMVDPLWQAPHKPCGSDPADPWRADDGSGTQGQYFPPYEEARLAPPAGAPAYPAGLGVNYTGYVASLNAGGNGIAECNPPARATCENPRWSTQLLQEENCAWDIPADECNGFEP